MMGPEALRWLVWMLVALPLVAGCATSLAASGRVSWTAEAVCASRAIGAKHPDPKVRNPDYLAERFVSDAFWRHYAYPNDYDRARAIMDRWGAPVYFFVNARTHHIDALLIEAADAEITQVVNLGAGFDSRALRFGERFPRVRFYELDLPAMIKAKRERVVEIRGAVPDHLVLVPTDFNTQPLAEVLRAAGYDHTRRTFFIWEGVTMYLPEEANRATLRFIGSAAPGSSVVYDYSLDAALRPDGGGLYGARSTVETVARYGEPHIFGWSQAGAAAFAAAEGLALVSDLGPIELTARYLMGSDGKPDGRIAEFARIIHVRVP